MHAIDVDSATGSKVVTTNQWELKINIGELNLQEQTLRVSGETHVGGVICALVDKLAVHNNTRTDWSDFALWWPNKSLWLTKTKQTLDQYGVQADAVLHYTRMHKSLRVQLPDMQVLDMRVDFAQPLFHVVKNVCRQLRLRHPEELSFLRVPAAASKNHATIARRLDEPDGPQNRESISSNSTLNNSPEKQLDSSRLFVRELSHTRSVESQSGTDQLDYDLQSFAFSPILQTQDVLAKCTPKFKNLFDKTRVNNKWLDSSKSLLEQNIKENDLVQLRFKYYAFFDLDLKHDLVRVNQIYEQAKWSVLSEEMDCTEQELINFAALQLQIQLQTKSLGLQDDLTDYLVAGQATGEPGSRVTSNQTIINRTNSLELDQVGLKNKLLKSSSKIIDEEDDLDTALTKLEKSLDIDEPGPSSGIEQLASGKGECESQPRQSVAPTGVEQSSESSESSSSSSSSLSEYLVLIKPQKYTFKKLKMYFFTLSDTHYLSYFKSREDSHGKPIDKINLKACELIPDVSLASRRFGITIKIPSSEGMTDLCLRCPDEQSYASWMSALKLASKMRPLSDPAYGIEVKSILNLLSMQSAGSGGSGSTRRLNQASTSVTSASTNLKSFKSSLSASFQSIVASTSESAQVQAVNLLPNRILKKHKAKQLNDRILEAYSTISDLDMFESKLRYIKSWQALPNYGISYFAVKIKGSKFREELVGIASNRLLRVSPEGETLKSWRFNTMKSWNVNWDINQFEIVFDDEELVFLCLSCEAKILHEFIGGYIYLSLRPKLDNNNLSSNLNEEMFFKLTDKR